MSDGKVIIETELDTSGFEEGLEVIEHEGEDIKIDLDVDKSEKKLGNISNIISKITGKMLGMSASSAKMLINIGQMAAKMGAIGGLIGGIVLIVITIWKYLKNALKENEKFHESIAKIKYLVSSLISALGQILAPIINGLVNAINWILDLVVKLLYYTGYLIQSWFKVNVFSNNFAENIENASGEAKKLKKTLAGFDEMNILEDTSQGGGGGTTVDIPKPQDYDFGEPPKWLVAIKDIGQWVIDHWQEVLGLLLLTKLFFDILTGNWIGVIFDVIGFIILAIPQIWGALKTLWESLKEVFAMLWDLVVKSWNNVKDWLKKAIDWIYNTFIKPVGEFFSKLWDGVKNGVKSAINWVKEKFNSIVDFFSVIISKIIGFFKTIGTKVGDAIGTAFKNVINSVLSAVENILNFPIKSINKLIDKINTLPGVELGTLSTFKFPRLAKGGIINMPGKGVYRGGAFVGEAGPEGQVPLTNDRSLEIIGETIAKHTVINFTNITKLDNRQIAREQRKINQQQDFAFNK